LWLAASLGITTLLVFTGALKSGFFVCGDFALSVVIDFFPKATSYPKCHTPSMNPATLGNEKGTYSLYLGSGAASARAFGLIIHLGQVKKWPLSLPVRETKSCEAGRT
jgi:hypothetical protein